MGFGCGEGRAGQRKEEKVWLLKNGQVYGRAGSALTPVCPFSGAVGSPADSPSGLWPEFFLSPSLSAFLPVSQVLCLRVSVHLYD